MNKQCFQTVISPWYIYIWETIDQKRKQKVNMPAWILTRLVPRLEYSKTTKSIPQCCQRHKNHHKYDFLIISFASTLCIFSWITLPIILKPTLVQVMAWYHQAASHYLNQCWLRYMSAYGLTKPQWVKPLGILANDIFIISSKISYQRYFC